MFIVVLFSGTRMSHLESLQGDRGNKLLLYGRKIPMVVDEINARKKEFTQLPRGPLGKNFCFCVMQLITNYFIFGVHNTVKLL